ncbi:MAG: DNA-directed RNA polymerase subunit delta [Candidatus Coprovivens sp.]
MKLKDLSKEELEAMSYDDIALMIITESGKQYKINELFRKVCDLLGLSEAVFMDKLPAFFDVLSTDHRFIMLENGTWDLKTKHSTKVVFESEEEDMEDIEVEEEQEEIEEEENEDIFNDNEDEIDDDDDDLKDLVIIDEDEEANG